MRAAFGQLANTELPQGTEKQFRVGAFAMAPSGRLLGVLRSPAKHRAGATWGVPGGKIDAGETPQNAAIREFFEETGGILTAVEPLWFEPETQNAGTVRHLFFLGACAAEFTPVLDHEHTTFQWCYAAHWPRPVYPAAMLMLADADARGRLDSMSMRLFAQRRAPAI